MASIDEIPSSQPRDAQDAQTMFEDLFNTGDSAPRSGDSETLLEESVVDSDEETLAKLALSKGLECVDQTLAQRAAVVVARQGLAGGDARDGSAASAAPDADDSESHF